MTFFFAFTIPAAGFSNVARERRAREAVKAAVMLDDSCPREDALKVCRELVDNATGAQAKKYGVEIGVEMLAAGTAPDAYSNGMTREMWKNLPEDEKTRVKAMIEETVASGYAQCLTELKK